MVPASRLSWVLWHLLRHVDRFGVIEPEDVVAEWLEYDHSDERLAASVLIHLRAKAGPVTLPDGTAALVVVAEQGWQAVDVWVQMGSERAGLQELAQAARRLLQADDPPSAPMSIFPARNGADEPPAFLRRHQPAVSTNPAPVSTWRPAPVKPAAPRVKPAAPARQQLSLF